MDNKTLRFSIRNKIAGGFLCLFLVLLITIGITIYQLNDVTDFSENLISNTLPTYKAAKQLDYNLILTVASFRGWILTNEAQFIQDREKAWNEIENEIAFIDSKKEILGGEKIASQWG